MLVSGAAAPLKPSVCCFLSAWTCDSLIPVTFLLSFGRFSSFASFFFSFRLFRVESGETVSSTCHLHECTDPTLNSVAWGNLHEDFVQLFSPWQYEQCERHAWSTRRCQSVTSPSLSVYRAALQAEQVFGLQGRRRRRRRCQLLSHARMWYSSLETLHLLKINRN